MSESESRGAMTAQQFWPEWALQTFGEYPDRLTPPDWALAFADALSAHNMAELRAALEAKTKELIALENRILPRGDLFEAERNRLIDIQKRELMYMQRVETLEAELERLRSQGAGQWEAESRRILEMVSHCLRSYQYGNVEPGPAKESADAIDKFCATGEPQTLVGRAGLASPPEGQP